MSILDKFTDVAGYIYYEVREGIGVSTFRKTKEWLGGKLWDIEMSSDRKSLTKRRHKINAINAIIYK